MVLVALDNSAAELVLLPRTPGEDTALFVQSEGVVGPADQVFDLLEAWEQDRGGLHPMRLVEAEDSIVALCKLISKSHTNAWL